MPTPAMNTNGHRSQFNVCNAYQQSNKISSKANNQKQKRVVRTEKRTGVVVTISTPVKRRTRNSVSVLQLLCNNLATDSAAPPYIMTVSFLVDRTILKTDTNLR
jgi:hypothetical protein